MGDTREEQLAIDGGSPVRDTFLVFGRPSIQEPEIQEVVATLRSGWLGTGPKTHAFEESFRQYVGCRHAVAVNSCTAALHLALDALGIGAGDEVITTPMTFVATANVILHVGATPVFVDIDPRTMNIDPDAIEAATTPRTKAIIPVHMAGRPCQMDRIIEIARAHDLYVIEDAAHAVGASIRGRRVGSIGDITCFSFYATKNLVTGEGGMVTTDNAMWAERIRIRSLHGLTADAWKRYSAAGYQPYEALYPGYKYNMTDLQASLGIHQLARLEANMKARQRIFDMYDEAFSELALLSTPVRDEGIVHACHLYTILLRLEAMRMHRDEFLAALKAENIGTGVHFHAIHLHKYYRERFGYSRGDFPHAEEISDRTLSLPLSPDMTENDVTDVVHAVRKVLAHAACHH
jgi:dTDP-4-amino-4,6-dideoxygalactose transaminase